MQFLFAPFYSDKAPIVITLLAAAIGWATVRTAEKLSETPFLEYRLESSVDDKGANWVELRFRNITRKFSFKCLSVSLLAPNGSREEIFTGEHVQVIRSIVAPVSREEPGKTADEIAFDFKNLSPGADIAVKLQTVRNVMPSVVVAACRDSNIDENAPHIVPASFQTWFVEHEFEAIWGAIAIWLFAVVAILSFKPNAQAKTGEVP